MCPARIHFRCATKTVGSRVNASLISSSSFATLYSHTAQAQQSQQDPKRRKGEGKWPRTAYKSASNHLNRCTYTHTHPTCPHAYFCPRVPEPTDARYRERKNAVHVLLPPQASSMRPMVKVYRVAKNRRSSNARRTPKQINLNSAPRPPSLRVVNASFFPYHLAIFLKNELFGRMGSPRIPAASATKQFFVTLHLPPCPHLDPQLPTRY